MRFRSVISFATIVAIAAASISLTDTKGIERSYVDAKDPFLQNKDSEACSGDAKESTNFVDDNKFESLEQNFMNASDIDGESIEEYEAFKRYIGLLQDIFSDLIN